MGALTYTCLDVVMGREVVQLSLLPCMCPAVYLGTLVSLLHCLSHQVLAGLLGSCVSVIHLSGGAKQRPLVYSGDCCNGCTMLGLGSLYLRQPLYLVLALVVPGRSVALG